MAGTRSETCGTVPAKAMRAASPVTGPRARSVMPEGASTAVSTSQISPTRASVPDSATGPFSASISARAGTGAPRSGRSAEKAISGAGPVTGPETLAVRS